MVPSLKARLSALAMSLVMAASLLLGSVVVAPDATAAIRVQREAEDFFTVIMNNVRVNQLGKNALRKNGFVRRQARQHSRNMARNDFFDHRGFQQRFNRIHRNVNGVTRACENIAFAQGYTNHREVARIFLRGWRKSPSHRRCMFSQMGWQGRLHGIGIVRDGNTWWGTLIVTD